MFIHHQTVIEIQLRREDKKELPCKDMDLDCLPDGAGDVPFGNYSRCYAYNPKQGICPFMPIKRDG